MAVLRTEADIPAVLQEMTLERLWRHGVARNLPGTAAEKNKLRDQMYAELSEVEIIQ